MGFQEEDENVKSLRTTDERTKTDGNSSLEPNRWAKKETCFISESEIYSLPSKFLIKLYAFLSRAFSLLSIDTKLDFFGVGFHDTSFTTRSKTSNTIETGM